MQQRPPICPYCRAASAPAFQFDEKRMTVCSDCGAWFVWPQPSPSDLRAHYERKTPGLPDELALLREGTTQRRTYDRIARRLQRRMHDVSGVQRIVDIGSGDLSLAAALARAFPHAHVEAWDLFAGEGPSAPDDVSSRVSAVRVDLNEPAKPQTTRFDLVVAYAVLEHVLDPLALLSRMNAMLRDGGFAYVAAPHVAAPLARLLGRRWPYYCPDEHLTLPTRRSIAKAMVIAGIARYRWRRIAVDYSLQYLLRYLGVRRPIPRIADVVLPIPAGAFELTWRRGDAR